MRTKSSDTFFKKLKKRKSFQREYERLGSLMQIAVAISKAREEAGLAQSQLAVRLGTTQSVISRIENGNQNLSVEMLSRIASELDCHLLVGLEPIHKKAA